MREEYLRLVQRFGSEFRILLDLPEVELKKGAPARVVEAIQAVRSGKLEIRPGYDGVYSEIHFPFGEDKELTLFS